MFTTMTITPIGPMRAIVLACGPSLCAEQIEAIRSHIVATGEQFLIIGINKAYELCPFIDIQYAGDVDFWTHFGSCVPKGVKRISTWAPETGEECPADYVEGVHYIRGMRLPGFSSDRSTLNLGGNSGHHAIQIAMHYGCNEIMILGMDMSEPGGKKHFFGDYGITAMDRTSHWKTWIQNMNQSAPGAVKRGVSILNCSEESALQCFPKLSIYDALAQRQLQMGQSGYQRAV